MKAAAMVLRSGMTNWRVEMKKVLCFLHRNAEKIVNLPREKLRPAESPAPRLAKKRLRDGEKSN